MGAETAKPAPPQESKAHRKPPITKEGFFNPGKNYNWLTGYPDRPYSTNHSAPICDPVNFGKNGKR